MSLFRVSSPSPSVGRGRGEEEGKERRTGGRYSVSVEEILAPSFAVRRMYRVTHLVGKNLQLTKLRQFQLLL